MATVGSVEMRALQRYSAVLKKKAFAMELGSTDKMRWTDEEPPRRVGALPCSGAAKVAASVGAGGSAV